MAAMTARDVLTILRAFLADAPPAAHVAAQEFACIAEAESWFPADTRHRVVGLDFLSWAEQRDRQW